VLCALGNSVKQTVRFILCINDVTQGWKDLLRVCGLSVLFVCCGNCAKFVAVRIAVAEVEFFINFMIRAAEAIRAAELLKHRLKQVFRNFDATSRLDVVRHETQSEHEGKSFIRKK